MPVYAVWSSYEASWTSNEGSETLKQQWMSLITAHHHISSAERVPQTWYIAWKLRVILGKNDTCLTIRCLYMLSEAPMKLPRHLMKVMNHSSSNGCLSLQRSITFPVLRGCPKSDILHENWELFFGKNDTCLTMRCMYILSGAPVTLPIHLMKVMKHSSSNRCLSL